LDQRGWIQLGEKRMKNEATVASAVCEGPRRRRPEDISYQAFEEKERNKS
jgi:hypothetical protein